MMMTTLSLVRVHIAGQPTWICKNIKASLPCFDNSTARSFVMQSPAKVQQCQIRSYALMEQCYALQWKTLPLSRQSMQKILDIWSCLCVYLVEEIKFSLPNYCVSATRKFYFLSSQFLKQLLSITNMFCTRKVHTGKDKQAEASNCNTWCMVLCCCMKTKKSKIDWCC